MLQAAAKDASDDVRWAAEDAIKDRAKRAQQPPRFEMATQPDGRVHLSNANRPDAPGLEFDSQREAEAWMRHTGFSQTAQAPADDGSIRAAFQQLITSTLRAEDAETVHQWQAKQTLRDEFGDLSTFRAAVARFASDPNNSRRHEARQDSSQTGWVMFEHGGQWYRAIQRQFHHAGLGAQRQPVTEYDIYRLKGHDYQEHGEPVVTRVAGETVLPLSEFVSGGASREAQGK